MLIRNKTGIIQNQYRMKNGLIVNEYHLVYENGFCVGGFKTPFDGQITEDLLLMDDVTKEFALRWRVISRNKKK